LESVGTGVGVGCFHAPIISTGRHGLGSALCQLVNWSGS
jgi:hypothetical protein